MCENIGGLCIFEKGRKGRTWHKKHWKTHKTDEQEEIKENLKFGEIAFDPFSITCGPTIARIVRVLSAAHIKSAINIEQTVLWITLDKF